MRKQIVITGILALTFCLAIYGGQIKWKTLEWSTGVTTTQLDSAAADTTLTFDVGYGSNVPDQLEFSLLACPGDSFIASPTDPDSINIITYMRWSNDGTYFYEEAIDTLAVDSSSGKITVENITISNIRPYRYAQIRAQNNTTTSADTFIVVYQRHAEMP